MRASKPNRIENLELNDICGHYRRVFWALDAPKMHLRSELRPNPAGEAYSAERFPDIAGGEARKLPPLSVFGLEFRLFGPQKCPAPRPTPG